MSPASTQLTPGPEPVDFDLQETFIAAGDFYEGCHDTELGTRVLSVLLDLRFSELRTQRPDVLLEERDNLRRARALMRAILDEAAPEVGLPASSPEALELAGLIARFAKLDCAAGSHDD